MTIDDLACGRRWCIAGGFATCPQMANDADVWIFADEGEDLAKLMDDFRTCFPEIEPQEQARTTSESCIDPGTGIHVLRVGVAGRRHIMVTDARNVFHLLSGFDVSTHQCAISDEGTFVAGPDFTPITEPPVALLDTPNTATRMAKIRSRYAPQVR